MINNYKEYSEDSDGEYIVEDNGSDSPKLSVDKCSDSIEIIEETSSEEMNEKKTQAQENLKDIYDLSNKLLSGSQPAYKPIF